MSCRPAGTVFGTLLNFRGEWDALGDRMNQAPYKAPPKAPVLYIKPANTWSADGAAIVLPAGVAQVEVGATIGMVMKAPGEVGGYVLMNDLSLPHASLFRPPVKFKCLDGFLGVGREVVPLRTGRRRGARRAASAHQRRAEADVRFDQLVRTPAQLLADVGEFMTLRAGDVLMLGCDVGRPLAQAGDRIEISAAGFAPLVNTLVAEDA